MADLGLNIALTGLFAQKKAIDVAGNNIANASTSGYSRQRVELVTNEPWPVPSLNMSGSLGQMGTGVNVKSIERVHDLFLDQQLRQQNVVLGEWTQRSDALQQLETIFNDPSDSGLSTALGDFWDAWNQLSKYPDNLATRSTLVETSTTLADTLRNSYNQLQTLKDNLNNEINIKVGHINDYLDQLADLNKQIQAVTAAGLQPNDLMDRRDALLSDLSKTVSIQVTIQADGTATVAIGNAALLSGPNIIHLETSLDASGNNRVGFALGAEKRLLDWSDLGGELKGLATARDLDVAGAVSSLNQLAVTLSYQINTLHMGGYGENGETDIPFFVGSDNAVTPPADANQVTGAGTIYVNPYLASNPAAIAAASGVTESTTTTPGVAPTADPPDPGTAQVITLTIGSGAAVNKTLQITVTAAGMANSPQLLEIPVLDGDTADDIAAQIRTALNANANVTSFFTVTGAGADVVLTALTPAENDDTMNVSVSGIIATGASPASGDNGNALKLYKLKDQKLTFADASGTISTATADTFYDSMISKLGVNTSQAENMVTNQTALVDQLQNRILETSGVSLDEEMANLILYQNAYGAAAKLVSVIDSMMQTLINMKST
jgi:flagellar hook-associated protein 1 FlgK